MSLIDPTTGHALPQPVRKISDTDIAAAFQTLQLKVDHLGSQVFTLSMLIEYMTDKIVTCLVDEEGNPLVKFDDDEWGEFYRSRVELMKEEAQEIMAQRVKSVSAPVSG